MLYQTYNYCGLTICYRTEHRQGGDALILSLRGPDGRGRIQFEDKPHRLPKASNGNLEKAAELLVPKFLQRCFAIATKEGRGRRQIRPLSLGAAWAADYDMLLASTNWSASTASKYRAGFGLILAAHGATPLAELTPAVCAPTLDCMSLSKCEGCILLLRSLIELQCKAGLMNSNPWDSYKPSGRVKKPSHSRLLGKNLRDTMLTAGQCQDFVRRCFASLGRRDGVLYFAALLLLFLGLPPEQICALQFQDMQYLEHYPSQLTIRLAHEYCRRKGKKGYIRSPLDKPFKVRQIPVPAVIAEAFQLLYGVSTPEDVKHKQCPVIHSPENKNTPVTPKRLRKWLNKTFRRDLQPPSDFGPSLPVTKLLQNTAIRNLARSGYEDEELRHHQGHTPTLVSAKHYCDFSNEAELNKLSRLQERWSNPPLPNAPIFPQGSFVLKAKGHPQEWLATGFNCGVDFTLTIPPIPPETLAQHKELSDGLLLEFTATRGMDGIIDYTRR